MFGDGALTFQEFAMGERLPLATIHEAVLEFLRDRSDAALYGAQAVNAYVDDPRMTQDVDILSTRAAELAEEIKENLNEQFHVAIRVRTVADGAGYRLDQVSKPKNRHLVDVRSVEELPSRNLIERVLVPTPPMLITQKVVSMVDRPNTAKGMIDGADLRRLLLAFPELKRPRKGPSPTRYEPSRHHLRRSTLGETWLRKKSSLMTTRRDINRGERWFPS